MLQPAAPMTQEEFIADEKATYEPKSMTGLIVIIFWHTTGLRCIC